MKPNYFVTLLAMVASVLISLLAHLSDGVVRGSMFGFVVGSVAGISYWAGRKRGTP